MCTHLGILSKNIFNLLFFRVIPIPITVENQLPYRLMKAADVDHRNLISLTGSPANHNVNDNSMNALANSNNLWSTGDQDYR